VDLNELLSVLAIAIAYTILIEYPFNNLKSQLIDRRKVARLDGGGQSDMNSNVKSKNM
jgi:hypothetical protein